MKNTALCVILLSASLLCVHLLPAQNAKTSAGLGIVGISDESTRLNYNQLFKMILKDNPATLDGKALTVDLVEHQSQADVAVKASFLEGGVAYVFYKNGQLVAKDTLRVPSLETLVDERLPALQIESTPDGFAVVNVSEKDQVYAQGIRNGDILLEVGTATEIPNNLEKVRILLKGTPTSNTLYVKLKRPSTGVETAYWVKIQSYKKPVWQRPLQTEQLHSIFKALLFDMAQPTSNMGIVFKKGYNFSMKSIAKAKSLAGTGKCKSYEQLTMSAESRMHGVSPSVNLDSIFGREKFYLLKESKKVEPGEAALHVLRYYNFDQRESYLSDNDHVSGDVKGVVRQISGPFYHKPGVFANYFIAAKQYEKAGNYTAALNQYYGAYLKIDDMIAGELVKAKAKRAVLGCIAHCTKQINQPEYSALVLLAHDCLKITTDDVNLKKQNSEFYDFSQNTFDLCVTVENTLAKQRSEKRAAIFGAVLNAGMGVATLSLDNLDNLVSTGFFVNAIDIMNQNDQLNYEINTMLTETTQSIEFNLPPELRDDEDSSPFELIATAAISYALERSTDKTAVLDRIEQYAAKRPAMKRALETTQQQYRLNSNNLDSRTLVGQLIRTEKTTFRYEKRGFALPEAISIP